MDFANNSAATVPSEQTQGLNKSLKPQKSFYKSMRAFSFRKGRKTTDTEAAGEPAPPGAGGAGAGPLSRLLYLWVGPLVRLAARQPLLQEHLWPIRDDCRATRLADKFDREWELEMQKPKGQRSLAKALFRLFRRQLIITGLLNLLQNGVLLVTPQLIRAFLVWMEDDTQELYWGFVYAGLMFAIGSVFNGVLSVNMFMELYRMGMDARTALNAVVYRKSLNLSNAARQTVGTGEVVTLMSNDAERLPMTALSLHNVWITPMFLAVGITMLGQLVGVAALGGVLFLVLMIPVQGKLAFKSMGVTRRQMMGTDQRIKLLNEILQGIKIVKYYAWEASFKERVTALRDLELKQIREFAMINASTISLLMSTPFVMILLTLLLYFATGGAFRPDVVFTAVALLYVIRFPLFMLPMAISSIVSGSISLRRMQRFMELGELLPEDHDWEEKAGAAGGKGGSVEVEGARFKWAVDAELLAAGGISGPPKAKKEKKKGRKQQQQPGGAKTAAAAEGAAAADREEKKEAEEAKEEAAAEEEQGGGGGGGAKEGKGGEEKKKDFVLEVPELKVAPGELLGVVGQVGSGKSSLASLLLGEMTRVEGRVALRGSVAYVAQSAWIVNATLRRNVTMGRPFDREWYDKVLAACALGPDLAMLPAGDATEIGEKGINLSGGQKQRVALARAAYADADLYVLDDPLSAVDAHVGRHLFDQLIGGLLRGKTRVLCTNQLHFLPQTDKIVVLKEGKITEQGSYQKLISNKGEFSVLMETFEGKEEEENEEKGATAAAAGEPAEGGAAAGAAAGAAPAGTVVGKAPSKDAKDGTLVVAEGKGEGSVKLQVFKTYLVDGTGGWTLPVLLFAMAILTQASSNCYEWWLSFWTGRYMEDEDEVDRNKYFYMLVYFGLAAATVGLTFMRGLAFALQGVACSRHLHAVLTDGIIRAPAAFFDTTPIGRVLNRFSKDMDNIDLSLPRNLPQFMIMLLQLVGTVATICMVLPWFALPIVPIMGVYYLVQKRYRPVSRDLQRLESVSRSPIFAQFSETLQGVATVRAFDLQAAFVGENERRLDESNKSFYLMHVCNRWLQLRLELLGGAIMLSSALLLAASRSTSWIAVNAGAAGLVLTYTQQITGGLNWTVRMGCETESRITSAERIKEYGDLEHEAQEVNEEYRPPANWPSAGALEFRNLSMRYRPGLDLVLREVNLSFRGGEKVGVAGRTGSGKSSLMVALFRLAEPAAGAVFLDGLDCSRLGLRDLRRALSIIPQDPVMFHGSLRDNLDPFHQYDDATVWEALRAAHLHDYVAAQEGKLGLEVAEGGENLSLGQRQLVCLARAVLRQNRVLVMDEATANIDMETDALIQKTIRERFAQATVLTIAHRLHTIMDCDRVLVMRDGRAAECAAPAALLRDPGSLLAGLVAETGPRAMQKLIEIANEAEKKAAPRS
mmetsp:Transcript_3016/g.5269  ORF Transcript_3016/g.5269 Transcript_3016/m.5269 type:complete len:1430 (+) Transcript_3016:168-4457(+)|eukprot:CAMPEP_0194719918 /NCGR_PEP_ID=MMETSP0296-20130528/11311_1 /TAXON_ID=39354 /ORGANISM="Heterosigma akashiwo, Strain CCMP2393" /LENGTH=1429 /DNA_ID=CAMNT_0039621869 /DNA_START=168 /DNA_END=4457 /DNA_ORIENTATION=-